MRSKKTLSILAACGLIGMMTAALFPQARDEIELTRAMIQTQRQEIVAKQMNLTDAESRAFWPLYRRYHNELSTLEDKFILLIEDYSANYESMTDEVAGKLLDEFLAIQKGEVDLKLKYVDDFRKVLPLKKVARYYQVENKLDTAVEHDIMDAIPLVK